MPLYPPPNMPSSYLCLLPLSLQLLNLCHHCKRFIHVPFISCPAQGERQLDYTFTNTSTHCPLEYTCSPAKQTYSMKLYRFIATFTNSREVIGSTRCSRRVIDNCDRMFLPRRLSAAIQKLLYSCRTLLILPNQQNWYSLCYTA